MQRKRSPLAVWRREGLRKKQAEIAKILRTSQGHISAIETGHEPEPFEWDRIADAYELSVKRLLGMIRAAKTEELPLFADLKPVDGRVIDMPAASPKAVQA